MPNSSTLWMAAGLLWILDASINISMEPFRAFVSDLLPPSDRTRGFAMQSLFIGLGAVIASAAPWMLTNWFGVAASAPLYQEGVEWAGLCFGAYSAACFAFSFFLPPLAKMR